MRPGGPDRQTALRPLLGVVAAALNLGFGLGLGLACWEVHRQGYWEQDLHRLAFRTLEGALGPTMAALLVLGLGALLLNRFLVSGRRQESACLQLALFAGAVALLSWPFLGGLQRLLDYLYVTTEQVPRSHTGLALLTGFGALAALLRIFSRRVSLGLPDPGSRLARLARPLRHRGAAVACGLAALTLPLLGALDRALQPPAEPNVVMIVVDTLRADHLGAYGYERDTSPAIDALARDAILFRSAQSPAPWTTPALASVHTGLYPPRLGFGSVPVRLAPRLITFAEILAERNYRTHAIVSNLFASSGIGFDQGFDAFDEQNARGHDHVSSPSVTRKAIRFLDAHADERFFLYLHYFDPHFAYRLHEPYAYFPDYQGSLSEGLPIDALRALAPRLEEDDVAYLEALYDSEIRFTDHHIGLVLERLKALGLYQQSLVVFLSDHGEEFLERGDAWIGHTRSLYEEQLHVPLLVKLPGNERAGTVLETRVGLVHLAPSLLAWLGIPSPRGYAADGRAIGLEPGEAPLLLAETRRWADLQAVTRDPWKLIRDARSNQVRLYHLRDDPQERVDLAERFQEQRRTLEQVLERSMGSLREAALAAPEVRFSEAQTDQLRSLGYVE